MSTPTRNGSVTSPQGARRRAARTSRANAVALSARSARVEQEYDSCRPPGPDPGNGVHLVGLLAVTENVVDDDDIPVPAACPGRPGRRAGRSSETTRRRPPDLPPAWRARRSGWSRPSARRYCLPRRPGPPADRAPAFPGRGRSPQPRGRDGPQFTSCLRRHHGGVAERPSPGRLVNPGAPADASGLMPEPHPAIMAKARARPFPTAPAGRDHIGGGAGLCG